MMSIKIYNEAIEEAWYIVYTLSRQFTMTPRDRSFYAKHFFFSNRLVQLLLGLHNNNNNNNNNSKIQLIVFFTIIAFILLGFVHQLYQLFTTDFVQQSAIKVLQKATGCFLIIFSYSTIYYRFVEIKLIINRVKLDYKKFTDKEELKIIEKYTKETKLYVYIIIVLFSLYITSIISPCILNIVLYYFDILDDGQLMLPIPVNNVTNAGLLYYSLLIYQIIISYILLLIGCLFYSLYLVVVQHACCQFSIIILKIRRPFKNNSKYMKNVWFFERSREQFDWIVDIINCYRNVTEYVDLINCFSKINYLIAVFLSMFIIVFDFLYIFLLMEILQSAKDTMECTVSIVGSIFVLYLNFYLGQKLLNQSHAVFEEICKIPFYMLSIKIQKLLLFIMIRSGKLSMLSIGGMFVSSHEIFAGLMRKAFSFAMMYYSVQ